MQRKDNTVYPIIFSSIAVERMWGGDFIRQFLKQQTTNSSEVDKTKCFGELWLLSDRKDEESKVTNGSLKGLTLNKLWHQYSKTIFGIDKPTKSVFPLLIKIIDAGDDLSLQVHPKEANLKYLKAAEAKTEMWYVIDCKNGAEILAGFNPSFNGEIAEKKAVNLNNKAGKVNNTATIESKNVSGNGDFFSNKLSESGNLNRAVIDNKNTVSKEDFIAALKNPALLKKMVKHFASADNKYFFIPSGTIHAIGKGNLIFEIQQNSDTTYRVSDWGRKDKNGNQRALHIEESLQCINFDNSEVYNGIVKQNNLDSSNLSTTNTANLYNLSNADVLEQEITPNNLYFKLFTSYISSSTTINTFNSYKFLTVINGDLQISFNDYNYNIPKFVTVLLPAGYEYKLTPKDSKVTFLTYYALEA